MIRKWWKEFKRKDMEKRTPGLAQKNASIQQKMETAMKILNRRVEDAPVEFERRKNDEYKIA